MIRAAKIREMDRTELEATVYECKRRGAYRTWNAIAREQTRRLFA